MTSPVVARPASSPVGGKLLKRLLGLARRPPIEGFVDRVVAGEVHGWAFDPRRPDRRLLVVATLDGQVQAETLAELPRRDLAAAGKSDGKHGFRLRLPPNLGPETAGRLQIQVMVGAQRFPLQRGAIVLPAQDPPAPKPEPPKAPEAQLVGFIEACRERSVQGWAVNPNNPEKPALVDFYDGELYLGSAAATIDRPRLSRSGAPQGARGFVFDLPAGRRIEDDLGLRARISGTRHELKRSKSYTGPDGGDVGGEESPAREVDAGPSVVARRPLEAPADRPPSLLILAADDRIELPAQGEGTVALAGAEALAPERVSAALADADWVLLLPQGVQPAAGAADALRALDAAADAALWAIDDQASDDPRLDILLGQRAAAPLAVRASVLMGYGGAVAGEAEPGFARTAQWVVRRPGLRWAMSRARLTVGPTGAAGEPPSPTRTAEFVSLGPLGPWRDGPPPGLLAVLDQCRGLEIEVLSPVSASAGDWEDALRREFDARIRLRQVDGAAEGPGWTQALLRAASGDVLILFHPEAAPSADALQEVLAWTAAPGVGVTTAALVDGEMRRAGLAPTQDGWIDVAVAERGHGRVVPIASAHFLAVARSALVEAGVLDDAFLGDPLLELSLRLRRRGWRTVSLRTAEVHGPAGWLSGPEPPIPLPLQVAFERELVDLRR